VGKEVTAAAAIQIGVTGSKKLQCRTCTNTCCILSVA
jgi:hypothetical protein